MITKSLLFGAVHVGIAFSISYALTGSVAIAGAITVVEPVANTVAHYFFDRWWAARAARRARTGRGAHRPPALAEATERAAG